MKVAVHTNTSTWIWILIAALFTTVDYSRNDPNGHQWIRSKMQWINRMECYSTIQGNEVLKEAATWTGPWNHHAKEWKESDTKAHMLHSSVWQTATTGSFTGTEDPVRAAGRREREVTSPVDLGLHRVATPGNQGSAHDGLTVRSIGRCHWMVSCKRTQRSSSYSVMVYTIKQNKKTSSRSQEAGFSSQY